MNEKSEGVMRTMYHHSHNADGSILTEHCCGCWHVVHNEGLLLRCNECGEERDLTVLVDPTLSGVPYFQDRNGGWEG